MHFLLKKLTLRSGNSILSSLPSRSSRRSKLFASLHARQLATWTEPNSNACSTGLFVDQFNQTKTPALINLITQRYCNKSSLNAEELEELRRYSSTLNYRAENGDVEAQLHLALANIDSSTSSNASDDQQNSESLSWLEKVASTGDSRGQYYLGIFLVTGSFSDIALHPIGVPKPQTPYYIDIDNLQSFLGLDKGVNTVPTESNAQPFNFKKWLQSERRRLLPGKTKEIKNKAPTDRTDSIVAAEAGSEASVVASEVAPNVHAVDSESDGCSSKKSASITRGLQILSLAHFQGNLDATIALGILYLDTESKYYQESTGLELLQLASRCNSNQHNALAELKLGEYMLRKSESSKVWPKDEVRTQFMTHFTRAAELGNAEAQYFLATTYFHGYACPDGEGLLIDPDESKAMHWLLSAASSGHKPSLYYLATLYRIETEHEANSELEQQVVPLLKQASEGENPNVEALHALGEIYFGGLCGQALNYPLALKYFKAAGKLGNADSLVNVGVMHYSGLGTTVDYEKAFYSYQNASILHNYQAMRNLADMYERGIGVPESQIHAQYYRSLADETEFGTPSDAPALLQDLLSSATGSTQTPSNSL